MNKHTRQIMTSSKSNEYGTPQALFDSLNKKYGFTLDPCASEGNAKCFNYFTVKENGLVQSWEGEIVFMNPPYSKSEKACKKNCKKDKCKKPDADHKNRRGCHITEDLPGQEDWIKKAFEESKKPGVVVVGLLPVRTDTLAFHKYIWKKAKIEFIKGRLVFENDLGITDPAVFCSMLVIWGAKNVR